MILQIAVPVPLHKLFDYLPNDDHIVDQSWCGRRVRIEFARRQMVGVVLAITEKSDCPPNKMKYIDECIDQQAIIDDHQLALCRWASHYYHAPIGEVASCFLPKLLRQGEPCHFRQLRQWQLSEKGSNASADSFKRSTKQLQAWHVFKAHHRLTDADCRFLQISSNTIKQLDDKSLIEATYDDKLPPHIQANQDSDLILNDEQQLTLQAITKKIDCFAVFLIHGITGSGKTEIYLQAIRKILQMNKQVLVLVPEIGLTPQTIARFSARFAEPIAILHSKLTDRERLDNWLLAKHAKARIVIGTRSALFAPLPHLGLIIIDEEHDSSFKQQEGFRYSARDCAIKLAYKKNIPVLLGSATPSIESWHNAHNRKFIYCKLAMRAGDAKLPSYEVIDLRNKKCQHGISEALLAKVQQHLENGNQVLLFINRRGYSPVLMCRQCGWTLKCKHCEVSMTLHNQPRYCLCHHCSHTRAVPTQCENCQQSALMPLGLGTERIEEFLQASFPEYPLLRIDQDSTRRKGSMQAFLDEINTGKPQILCGTQMLAKGHHFPNVTLVGILDADNGIHSTDFRALEKLGQLILQVAGRAGRGDKPGHVVIQTHHPHHPLLKCLIENSFDEFANRICEERRDAMLPPYSHLALFRAQAHNSQDAMALLTQFRTIASHYLNDNVQLLGPVPAPMEKRANFYRCQLLLKSNDRRALHHVLSLMQTQIDSIKLNRNLKWNLDVDPIDLY